MWTNPRVSLGVTFKHSQKIKQSDRKSSSNDKHWGFITNTTPTNSSSVLLADVFSSSSSSSCLPILPPPNLCGPSPPHIGRGRIWCLVWPKGCLRATVSRTDLFSKGWVWGQEDGCSPVQKYCPCHKKTKWATQSPVFWVSLLEFGWVYTNRGSLTVSRTCHVGLTYIISAGVRVCLARPRIWVHYWNGGQKSR